ncbi:hypothetical protein CC78DRAFT_526195 [Lojkania enalia]|uniref:NACHT domain-containing protein n=1 Tax=Lojkania enalia TaxID=147567 RepID=A0A9P4JXL9_9PLEO|nr:hypothetical protein CC78DRAFT_526195 [Didymosphaeria enalia]
MEPLSALSIATSIVQFLDFTGKLISGSTKLYKSSNGTLAEHGDLSEAIQYLLVLSKDLDQPLRSKDPEQVAVYEQAIIGLARDTNHAAKELISTLEELKLKKNSRWESCLQALKTLWSQERINDLRSRVDGFRSQLSLNLIAAMRSEAFESHSNLKKDIDQLAHYTAEGFLKHIEESRQWQRTLAEEIRRYYRTESNYVDNVFVPSHLAQVGLESKARHFAKLMLSTLRFLGMIDRHDSIPKAHRKTFEWIFNDPEPQTTWTSFSSWLQSPSNLYWITGKPGSGKSTLMKFLYNDQRTYRLLSLSSTAPIVCSAFFFWNSGRSMQMSQEGLLQSLLHEMLSQCPEYAPIAFPEQWELFALLGHSPDFQPWTWSELVRGFHRLVDKVGTAKLFFFLIDGLDEYAGSHSELVKFLKDLLRYTNVKICTSSRPWVVFEDAFRSTPSLHVHELTYNDIVGFISAEFDESEGYRELYQEEPEYAAQLVSEIATKSSGVFLWVSIVVTSLLAGLSNGDRIVDLQKRLDELPADLENLFHKILDNLEPTYKKEASEIFQVFRASGNHITILGMMFADEYSPDQVIKHAVVEFPPNQLQPKLTRMRRRLNSRCRGLLEVAGGRGKLHNISIIQYLHRTVKDFIEEPSVWQKITAYAPVAYDPYLHLCLSVLMQLKTSRIDKSFTAVELLTAGISYSEAARKTADEIRITLLDQIHMSTQSQRLVTPLMLYSHISRHTSPVYGYCNSAGNANDFMRLMVCYRMTFYVRGKLEKGYSIKENHKAHDLISDAIAYSWCKDNSLDSTHFRNTGIVVQPDLELVKLLLDHGADPSKAVRMNVLSKAGDTASKAVYALLIPYCSKEVGKGNLKNKKEIHKKPRWLVSKFSRL